MIPISNASRRPAHIRDVTILVIGANAFGFVFELMGEDAFETRWSTVPAHVASGHDWITVPTAMFIHSSWSHIIGNM